MIRRVTRPVLQGDAVAKWQSDNERLGAGHLTTAWRRVNAEKEIIINPRRPVRRGTDTPRGLDYARKEWN